MAISNPESGAASPDDERVPEARPQEARAREPRPGLPPRGQRPLGHLARRQERVKLASRTGWFHASGMWGSFAFDVLFRTLIGLYAGYFLMTVFLVKAIGIDFGARFDRAEDPAGVLVLLWGLSPWIHVIVLNFRLKAKPEFHSRKFVGRKAMLWGAAYALIPLAI